MKKINKIKIKINGKYIKIQDKITLLNLMKKLKVPLKKVAIELNRSIVNKRSLGKIKIRKNPNCKLCGENPEVKELIDYEIFCGVPVS